jgi:hypothetical protein
MSERHADLYQKHPETVTHAEKALLASQELGIEFRIIGAEAAGLSQGRQSRVSVLEYERDGEPFRVLWKRMGAGKGLTESEARNMQLELAPYRSELIDAGWNVPKTLYSKLSPIDGEYQIFSYEQHIPGLDGEKMISNPDEPNFRKWYLANQVVRILADYPSESLHHEVIAGKTLTALPHGLDLKLANVVLEPNTDDLYLVDLFGPKRLYEHGRWRTYTAKMDSLSPDRLRAVTATREGAILRCWRLAEQHWVNGYPTPEALRADFLDQIEQSGLPTDELALIRSEIQNDYPWFEAIYQERQV